MKKIHNANVWEDEFFLSWVCFLTFLKKWKNTFLLVTFVKWLLWIWKCVGKKLVIGPNLHQKYYRNRIIFRKCMTFSICIIFWFPPLYVVVIAIDCIEIMHKWKVHIVGLGCDDPVIMGLDEICLMSLHVRPHLSRQRGALPGCFRCQLHNRFDP